MGRTSVSGFVCSRSLEAKQPRNHYFAGILPTDWEGAGPR